MIKSRVRTRPQSFSLCTLHSALCTRQLCWRWSVWMDSNHRPRAYQARALTTWATNRYSCVDSSHLTRVCLFFVEETRSNKLERLVEMMGFEPMTPCLQGRCSPNWATPPYHGLFSFQGSFPVPENWTTKDLYPAVCVPTSSWLVWQNRDILSRSP